MPPPDPKPLDRGAAAGLWRHTLSKIGTTFGRLCYLAGLRDGNTGRYQHHGLAALYGDEEAGNVLRASHEETFALWLGYPLERQKGDLLAYLEETGEELPVVLAAWRDLATYAACVPADARAMERELFLADLEALLELLRNERGAASPDRDA